MFEKASQGEEGSVGELSPIDMVNHNNLSYTGPVYFGTPFQDSKESIFVYDTGSGYLTTTSNECTYCVSQYYDVKGSSTARRSSLESKKKELDYGSATLVGYLGQDHVCLSKDSSICVQDFDFFVMTE